MKRFLIIYLLFPLALFGADFNVYNSNFSKYAGEFLEIYVDSNNSHSFEYIVQHEKELFKPSQQKVPNLGKTKAAIWIKLKASNPYLKFITAYATIEYNAIDSIEFYTYNTYYRGWEVLKTGFLYPHNTRAVDHRNYVFPLQLQPEQTKTYYLKIKNSVITHIPMKIGTEDKFIEYDTLSEWYYGLFLGVIAALIIYNLFLYSMLKDSSYLFYVLSAFFSLFTFLAISGHVFKYIVPNSIQLREIIIISSSAALIAFSGIFFLKALNIKSYSSVIYKVFIGFITIGFLTIALNLVVGRQFTVLYANQLIAAYSLFVIGSSYYLYQKGNKLAIYFSVAWFLYTVGGLVMTLRNIGVVEYNAFTTHSAELGAMLEVITLAYALGYKYKLLKEEKELSQAKLIAFQENENKLLEEKVQDRTQELVVVNDQLKLINQEITSKNKLVQESIFYSKYIQQSIMPSHEELNELFSNYFVYFKPRDIVSGDFYWAKQTKNYTYLAIADCTGHGIPGALMSMIGSNALNTIVAANKEPLPNEVLQELNEHVVATLNQKVTKNRDGMDITIARFAKSEVLVSMANHSFLVYENQTLERIKGDKFAIGGTTTENKQFTNIAVEVTGTKQLYFFSDGIQDQFGGPKGKKFMLKRITEWAEETSQLPIAKQKEELENRIAAWKQKEDQVDDQVLFSIKI